MTVETEKGHWSRYILCACLFAFGCVFFAIEAAMNADFGWSTGASDKGKFLQGAGGLAIAGMVPVVSLVAGMLWRARSYFAFAVAALVVAVYAAFALQNVIGFGAKERIATARKTEDKAAISKQLAQDARELSLKRQSEHIAWLKKKHDDANAAARKARNKEDRLKAEQAAQRYSDELGQIAFGTTEVQAASDNETTVVADPQATVLAEMYGISPEAVQRTLALVLGVLLITGTPILFGLSSGLLPRRRAVIAAVSNQGGGTPSSGNETTGIGSSGGGSNVVKLPAQRAAPNAAVETVSKAQDTGSESRIETDTNPPLEQSQWQDWDDEEPDADDLREVAEDQAIVAKPSRRHRHGEGKKRQWTRAQLKEFMELNDGVPNGDALKKYCDEQRRKNRDGTFAISRSTAWRAINDHKRKHPHDAVEARLVVPMPKRPPSTSPKLGRGLASLMKGMEPQRENGHAPN